MTGSRSDVVSGKGVFEASRFYLISVGLFSGASNILQLTVSIYMMQVFDRVLTTRNPDTLLYLTILASLAIAVFAILEFCRSVVMQRVASWVEARLAPEGVVRGIETQLRGLTYGMDVLRDLGRVRGFLGSPAMLALFDIPWVPVYLFAIFVFHPLLGWIAAAGAVLLVALAILNEFLTARLLRQAGQAAIQSHRRAEASARHAEVIDSMGMMPAIVGRWWRSYLSAQAPQDRAADRAAASLSLTKLLRQLLQIAVLGVGAWLVLQQELTAGASIAASIVIGRALAPVEQVVGGWKLLVQARESSRRLRAFLAMPRLRPPGLPLPTPAGALAVERISYALPGQGTPLIKGLAFELAAGESLAIIGPSGAGKTTLLRLITGTLSPSMGHVRLDGADVFQWQREDLGRHVGYLPQDVALFDGTVIENISRMAETPVAGAVFEATKLAGCHDMIQRLPQGYKTEIGDGGARLSGGQRQMIGLARALLGTPRLVVLDEPNSNLDAAGEHALGRALEQLRARGTTVVLVSHRPALLHQVDKILLLQDGAVEMFGPRAEILHRLAGPARPMIVKGAS